MTTLTIAEIGSGLTVAHALKAVIEVNNVSSKIKRLSDVFHKLPVKPFPVNINTRLKAYSSLFGLYGAMSVVIFLVVRWFNTSLRTTVAVIAVAAVVSELVYVVGLDRYHVKVASLTKSLEKK